MYIKYILDIIFCLISFIIPVNGSGNSFSQLKTLHTRLKNCQEELSIREQYIQKKDWYVTAMYVDGWIKLFDRQLPEFEQQWHALSEQDLYAGVTRQWQRDDIEQMSKDIPVYIVHLKQHKPAFDELAHTAQRQVTKKKIKKD